ncbi:MAG: UbiA family prenyltransferase [Candidatus Bathyarchaeota archaeon]|nr:UbiA family prenyltransferase [Candidatus Bathyarchaeota archaeon]
MKKIRLLATISRVEFLLPNLGSLIMGLAWGAHPPLGLIDGLILIVLSFLIINLSSAIGAQANSLYDYELDLKDERKKDLVQALESFGQRKLKFVLIIEFSLALILVSIFAIIYQKWMLIPLWIAGISLGVVYSAPPLRLKARSWIAPISLMIVLAVCPVLFAFYTFTFELSLFFILAFSGLALTVYGVIIPTELRDYFGDKAMGIQTFTVRLGLSRSALLGIILLSIGSLFTGTALFLEWSVDQQVWLSVFLLGIPVSVLFVLNKLWHLYSLSKSYETSHDSAELRERIVDLASDNPKWIMMVTQTYSILSVLLLASKFLF